MKGTTCSTCSSPGVKSVVLSESMMKKVLKHFMEKWTDGLCRWLFDAQATKEEAVA